MLLREEDEMRDVLNLIEARVWRHREELHEDARRRGNDEENVKTSAHGPILKARGTAEDRAPQEQ